MYLFHDRYSRCMAIHLVLVLQPVPVGDHDGVPDQDEGEADGEAVHEHVHLIVVNFPSFNNIPLQPLMWTAFWLTQFGTRCLFTFYGTAEHTGKGEKDREEEEEENSMVLHGQYVPAL